MGGRRSENEEERERNESRRSSREEKGNVHVYITYRCA